MTGETELSRQMRTRARAINKAGGLGAVMRELKLALNDKLYAQEVLQADEGCDFEFLKAV